MTHSIDQRLSNPAHPPGARAALDRLACPECRGGLDPTPRGVRCTACGLEYSEVRGVLDLRPRAAQAQPTADWSVHWSTEHQRTAVQRFFSFYRRAVFARAVKFYVDRYFSASGVFVEAGSGTSETSMRIDKRKHARVLVALDIVLPVLTECHPIMDARIGGDIFRLPIRDGSIDGLWNVGVMEHLTTTEIDRALREFRRVIRPGGRVLLLWPGADAVPQKMLDLLAMLINARPRTQRFQFHPPEISRLQSLESGRQILRRNGFDVVHADAGIRNLLAFKVLVGSTPDPLGYAAEAQPTAWA